MNQRPIAVFDSGIGGLSVVRRLLDLMPNEDIVYFGDTARVPYGAKSSQTVIHFALDDARFLLRFDPKLILVACNTASAIALPTLAGEIPLPCVGVVEPGANAAAALARGGLVTVLGTEATINSGAYERALKERAPDVDVLEIACPLFVPLVEEGRSTGDPVVRLVVEEYLEDARERGPSVAVLGCTHYPLLRDAIAEFLGPDVAIVDSGRETAMRVRELLAADDALSASNRIGSMRCYVSDNPARFRRIGSRFLQRELESVEFVEPEQYVSSLSSELHVD